MIEFNDFLVNTGDSMPNIHMIEFNDFLVNTGSKLHDYPKSHRTKT